MGTNEDRISVRTLALFASECTSPEEHTIRYLTLSAIHLHSSRGGITFEDLEEEFQRHIRDSHLKESQATLLRGFLARVERAVSKRSK